MQKRLYGVIRDLHLYVGLFLSPFLLIFAISVFYLVHAPRGPVAASQPTVVRDVQIPEGVEGLTGREQLVALRPVLDRLGVGGEINYVRRIAKEQKLVIPVVVPGRETSVELNLQSRTATISTRHLDLPEAMIYLHKMPGPHNVNLRGNSLYMKVWRVLADAATYGLIFLTCSGVYLWMVLKAERRVGLALLAAGSISFFGLIYAITL